MPQIEGVLQTSSLILQDPVTQQRISLAVNRKAWQILLGTDPEVSDSQKQYAAKLIRDPERAKVLYSYGVSSNEPIATSVLQAYTEATANGSEVDLATLLLTAIPDVAIDQVIGTAWNSLVAIQDINPSTL